MLSEVQANMEKITDLDKVPPVSKLETDIKTALALVHREEVTRENLKKALDSVLNHEYRALTEPYQEEIESAREVNNKLAVRVHSLGLKAVRRELQSTLSNGYNRVERALALLEDGKISFEKVSFDPERDNDGGAGYKAFGVTEGDTVVVVISSKNGEINRYLLLPTDTHSKCTCQDKIYNEQDFPVCKHEMAWILYQTTSEFVPKRDVLVGELLVDGNINAPDSLTISN